MKRLHPGIWAVLSVSFYPLVWRLFSSEGPAFAGLVSDLGIGLIFAAVCIQRSRIARLVLLGFWLTAHIGSWELMAAVQRFPSFQDLAFLNDPEFLKTSTAGIHLAHPGLAAGLMVMAVPALMMPVGPWRMKNRIAMVAAGFFLMAPHGVLKRRADDQGVARQYHPLHWFVVDGIKAWRLPSYPALSPEDLPLNLRQADRDGGTPLIDRGKARNVLLVVLEGISGIYLPDIREKMGITQNPFDMDLFSAGIRNAMLVPDFVTHSHQTIRGLYAIHCGDFSKFSYDLSKAMELQLNPDRARQCLPARLAAGGWATHYLQGAPLQFMSKDRAMPAMGFEHVHGLEWFENRTRTDFIWGTTDADFFTGAARYIRNLKETGDPWFLSLLTVATHQPFDADDASTARYGSRKIASVALLDKALERFMSDLGQMGVLDDTLVVFTSDESHGSEGPDWYSSWGFAAVLAPEQAALPRMKQGTYGLVDLEVSILDYLGLPLPPDIVGRSLFRDYAAGRDMISYTGGKLRWQTPERVLYECDRDQTCRMMRDAAIIGARPPGVETDRETAARLLAMARVLDARLVRDDPCLSFSFASGEIRDLPELIRNEWTDNLIGAQYLSFPANSRVSVDIGIKILSAGPEGVQPRLTLRQFEKEVGSILYPPFPVLHQGESHRLRFDFTNEASRESFSFHLTAAGRHARMQLETFDVVILRQDSKSQRSDCDR